jgi:hypothetical protein
MCPPRAFDVMLLSLAIVTVSASSPPPAAASAANVIDLHLANGDQPTFVAREPLRLNTSASVPHRLQGRFFCNTRQGLLKQPHRVSADGSCWIYESVVWKPSARDGQLYFGAIPLSWLGVDAGGRRVDQVYFLVFEDGDIPTGTIRIKADQVRFYFQKGQHIRIHAPADADVVELSTVSAAAAGQRGGGTKKAHRSKSPSASEAEPAEPTDCLEVAGLGQDSVRFASVKGCGQVSRDPSVALFWPRLLVRPGLRIGSLGSP